jgi:hypothetical protein
VPLLELGQEWLWLGIRPWEGNGEVRIGPRKLTLDLRNLPDLF